MGTNSKSITLADKLDIVEKVGEMYVTGKTPKDMELELGITRREVNEYIKDWQSLLRREATSGIEVKDKVMNILFETEAHWQRITKEAWKVVEEADQQGLIGQKTNALKLIASMTKDKAVIFEKFGQNQDQELIEEMNKTQQNQQVLIGLLKEIKETYPEVAEIIARRLTEIMNEVEPIVIHES